MHFPRISLRALVTPFRTHPSNVNPSSTAGEMPESAQTRGQDKRRGKISMFFQGLDGADQKRANPEVTRAFIYARLKLDEKKETLRAMQDAGAGEREDVRQLKAEIKQLKVDVQRFYVEGPQGLTAAAIKAKRKEQWKAAMIEFFHTEIGARTLAGLAGSTGVEVSGAVEKAVLRQSLGYGPQALLSGFLRIVTEVPQIRMNKGGKPKMPANLAASANFNISTKEMKAAMTRVQESGVALSLAYEVSSGDRSAAALVALKLRQEEFQQALAGLLNCRNVHENLLILLERECRGKKGSAVVSLLAILMSLGAYAVDQTGAGAIAAHKILCFGGFFLQALVSPFDFMDGTVDFPQKISAKRIDLASLIKAESRHKSLDEIGDADIETGIASSLYAEQPQLVRDTIHWICEDKIGELNGKRRKLIQEIETERYASISPSAWVSASARARQGEKKLQELNKVEQEFQELMSQIVHFKQHNHAEIDPDGLIGRAIADPVFFCKKGIKANVFNKMGEYWAQANQRISNNFNILPLPSAGPAAAAFDITGMVLGPHFFLDGIHSLQGIGADNPSAEAAMIGVTATTAAGAVNSAVTVFPSRFNKTIHDRKDLAAPACISKGRGIASAERQEQLNQAYRNGVLSKREKKKLEEAIPVIDAEEQADAPQPDMLARMQSRWNRFDAKKNTVNAMTREINNEWVFRPRDPAGNALLDHYGKPIVIDTRKTAACNRVYMPASERIMSPVKGIPRSILNSTKFWRDITNAAVTGRKSRALVENGKLADRELIELLARVERMLQPLPEIDTQIGESGPAGDFNLDDVLQGLANRFESVDEKNFWSKRPEMLDALSDLNDLAVWGHAFDDTRSDDRIEIISDSPSRSHATTLTDAAFNEQIEMAIGALRRIASEGIAPLDESEKPLAFTALTKLRSQARSLQDACSGRSREIVRSGMATRGMSSEQMGEHLKLTASITRLGEILSLIDGLHGLVQQSDAGAGRVPFDEHPSTSSG